MTLRLDRLQSGNMVQLPALWERHCKAIEQAFNSLEDTVAAIAAAQAAADAANTAAATANAVATSITDSSALGNSYVSGATITAADAGSDVTISISSHTRNYPQPDGTIISKAVNGGSLTGKAYTTRYFITYLDPTRAGGAVSYTATTTEPAQIGDLHVVGSVLTPAAAGAPTPGGTVRPPGSGSISYA